MQLIEFFDIVEFYDPRAYINLLREYFNTGPKRSYVAYDYNFTYLLDVEKRYFQLSTTIKRANWIRDHWYYSILFAAIYVAVIFSLQRFMKNRERLALRTPLIIWNLLLAVFSLAGAFRFIQNSIFILSSYGVEHYVCKNDYQLGAVGFWGWHFGMSKVAELIDTLFVVLRKQKLMFLHWYHHTTVLIYTWFAMGELTSTARLFSTMNYPIHALMYGYYAIKAMKFCIPKWVNIFITTLQLSQMVWGVIINVKVFSVKSSGRHCDVSYRSLYASFLMYLTYFFLFFNYFYNAYLKKTSPSVRKSADKKGK